VSASKKCFRHETASSWAGIFRIAELISHRISRSTMTTKKVKNRQKSSLSQVMPAKTSTSIHLPIFKEAERLNLSIPFPKLSPALSMDLIFLAGAWVSF
jgi:hypothetical protein